MPLTYAGYLKLDRLLSLQEPLSEGPEHDETLFIVIHQIYELWFKEVLHELDYVERLLARNDISRVLHTLKRVLSIWKILVAQLDVLETMTPQEFLTFRDRLESASGFQSVQFREIEFVLGRKSAAAVNRFPAGSEARRRLEERLDRPSLWDAFLHCLAREGYPVPADVLRRDFRLPAPPSPGVREILVGIYRDNPLLTLVCELFTDVDEGIQEWRYRHIKMVERTIGNKAGTGGSSGVEYLKTTLFNPLFPDLWAIRTEL